MKIYYETNELKHYGVVGMHWGHRKNINIPSGITRGASTALTIGAHVVKRRLPKTAKTGRTACNTILWTMRTRRIGDLAAQLAYDTGHQDTGWKLGIASKIASGVVAGLGIASTISSAIKEHKKKKEQEGEQ